MRYHVSPAREHDSPHRQIDESWRGYGLLADLAYASVARLRACETDDVHFVIRLKDHWKPKVQYLARGQVTRECFPGTDLDALLAEDILRLDGRAIDADVRVGGGTNPLPLRRVGVQTPKGDGCFLTNFPPRIGPLQIADLYRVRWEVEISQPYYGQESTCPSSQHEATMSVSALLKLSQWCQRRLDDQSGDVVWASPTTLPPFVPLRVTHATSTQEALLPQLWASLPPENRWRLSQIMARVIARHSLPHQKEVPDD